MNELFQHTVQPLGSSTSPVEDLALEVSDAFNKISERLDIEPNIITSYKESIGNPIFKDLKKHKIIQQLTETHNILETESNIVLENIPDVSSLSLSYLYNSNNINLTEVNNISDFTAYDQYKIEGKVITLNIKVQPGTSIAITVIYTCTTFDLNNEKILPNIFKKESGEWYLPATQLTEKVYELDYGKNISDSLNNYVFDLNTKLHFFSSEDHISWKEIDVSTYNIKNNKIEFESESLSFNTSTVFAVFVNNTSIAQLLNNLYVEFLNHNHSSSNISKNIDIKDIINKTVNVDNISYKNHKIPNYSFPQYLNREGHNPALDGVYENSLLGKLFISRVLSADGEKYKGLDEDSNKLMFADPELGHSLNYNKVEQALLLTSLGSLNGLKISTKGASKYALSLNGSKVYSDYTRGLKIEPEGKILDITSNDYSNKYTIKTDNLQVNTNAEIKNLKIGDINLQENTLTRGISIWTDNLKSLIDFKNKVLLSNVDINTTQIQTALVDSIDSNKVSIGNIDIRKDSLNNTSISRKLVENNQAILKSSVPIEATSIKVDSLESTTLTKLKNVVVTDITINGFRFGKSKSSEDFDVSGAEGLAFNFSADLKTNNLYSKQLSSYNYVLRENDRILVDPTNYIVNLDNRISFVQDKKSIDFIGSGKDTGISLKPSTNTSTVFKQYIASNSGAAVAETDKNLFLESDVTTGVYFLKSTDKPIINNGVTFGYNNPSAQKNISDLSKWFRQDLYTGHLEAPSINLAPSTGKDKNGLAIGTTKISVIGPEQDCPSGLTIFESADGIHLVQPMAANAEGCSNLVYQEVTSGSFNTKGDLSVDGNATITEDLVVSGTVAAEASIITGESETNSLEVNDTLKVNGKATFTSEVSFKNDLKLTNELVSQSRIEAKTLEVKAGTILEKNVDIGGNLFVDGAVNINSGVNINQGISINGTVKAKGIDIENLKTSSIENLGNMVIAGSLELQGKALIKNSISVQGNAEITSNLNVNNSIISRSLYTLEEVVCRGKLSVYDSAEISGKNVTLGTNDSLIQINGKLQFNTNDVTFNSPVKIYNSLRVADDAEISGKLYNKNGIETDSYLKVVGSLSVESSAQFNSNVNFKSVSVSQNLEVTNSLSASTTTTESLSVISTANIANLNVTNSLSMALNTNLIAGNAKFTALDVTDSTAYNNISGNLSISKDLDVIKNITVGQDLVFGNGSLILNNDGMKATDGTINIDTIKVNHLEGKLKVQPPSNIMTNTHPVALQIANSIPERNFIKLDNFMVEGISIFNNPVLVDTLVFKDLIYAGSASDSDKGFIGVDIIARRAVYA